MIGQRNNEIIIANWRRLENTPIRLFRQSILRSLRFENQLFRKLFPSSPFVYFEHHKTPTGINRSHYLVMNDNR